MVFGAHSIVARSKTKLYFLGTSAALIRYFLYGALITLKRHVFMSGSKKSRDSRRANIWRRNSGETTSNADHGVCRDKISKVDPAFDPRDS